MAKRRFGALVDVVHAAVSEQERTRRTRHVRFLEGDVSVERHMLAPRPLGDDETAAPAPGAPHLEAVAAARQAAAEADAADRATSFRLRWRRGGTPLDPAVPDGSDGDGSDGAAAAVAPAQRWSQASTVAWLATFSDVHHELCGDLKRKLDSVRLTAGKPEIDALEAALAGEEGAWQTSKEEMMRESQRDAPSKSQTLATTMKMVEHTLRLASLLVFRCDCALGPAADPRSALLFSHLQHMCHAAWAAFRAAAQGPMSAALSQARHLLLILFLDDRYEHRITGDEAVSKLQGALTNLLRAVTHEGPPNEMQPPVNVAPLQPKDIGMAFLVLDAAVDGGAQRATVPARR